jgi:predicted nucleotidyltransferase
MDAPGLHELAQVGASATVADARTHAVAPSPGSGKNGFMRPSEALNLHRQRIRQIALSHRVRDVRVFGSASTGEDTEESDLDLLVEPTAETTLFDIAAIRMKLKDLLGVEIDVLTPNSLPESFRAKVLEEAQPV